MATDSKNAKAEIKVEESRLKVQKDFKELGRITVEDLNEYFDLDLMASARRRRRD
tara:strand:- start:11706 stop:11870 length:165 start_codon:yes stop_codon:yes gene_type:complete